MPSSRKLAAILFSDITGYTSLMNRDENYAMEIILINRNLHKELIQKHNGTYHKEIGDGTLASFSSAIDAVACAIDIMAKIEPANYKLRIGIHLGDVLFEGTDVFGSGVNIASRIESIAVPGSILLSENVHNELDNHPTLQSELVGEVSLKNDNKSRKIYAVTNPPLAIPAIQDLKTNKRAKLENTSKNQHPDHKSNVNVNIMRFLALVVLIAAATFVVNYMNSKGTPEPQLGSVIAIFPFNKNVASGIEISNGNHIAAGLSEKLSLVRGISIINPTELNYSRDVLLNAKLIQPSDQSQLLNSIHATHYITGTFDDDLIVHLYDSRLEKRIWSGTYQSENTLLIIDSISLAVTEALNLSLTAPASAWMAQNRNPKSIGLYLEAMKHWHNRRDSLEMVLSIQLLSEALEVEPSDPDVNGLFALCLVQSAERFYIDWADVKERIMTHAQKALKQNSDQPYALVAIGGYHQEEEEYDLARTYMLKAFSVAPDRGITAQALAELNHLIGNHHEALENIKEAEKASPVDHTIMQQRAWFEMANGYANASKQCSKKLVLHFPEEQKTSIYKWTDYLIKDDYQSAFESVPQGRSKEWKVLLNGLIYIEQGDEEQFTAYYSSQDPIEETSIYIKMLWQIHHGNNIDKSKAYETYKYRMDEGIFNLTNSIQTYPFDCFESFRTDPSIQAIARKRGIHFGPHPYFRIQKELSKQ